MVGKLLLAGAVLGGLWLGLTPAEPEPLRFASAPDEALARLRAGRRVVEGTGMGSLTLRHAGRDGDALLVAVTRAGSRAEVRCRVRVTPDPEAGSRAAIDCAQPPRGDRPVQQVAIEAMEHVVTEHVVATVEARRYDIDKVADQMMRLVLVNRPVLAESQARGGN